MSADPPVGMDVARAFRPLRALAAAFRCARAAPLPIVIGGFLLCLLTTGDVIACVLFAKWDDLRSRLTEDPLGVLFVLLWGGCCAQLVLKPIWAIVFAGMARTVEDVLRTGNARLRDVFTARASWIAIFLTALLTSVLFSTFALFLVGVSITATSFRIVLDSGEGLAILFGLVSGAAAAPFLFYAWLGLLLAPYACAVEGLGPLQAIARSWRLARGHRIRLLMFRVVTFAVSLIGIPLCCVGGFATWAWSETAWLEAYLAVARSEEERRPWRLNVWAG